MLQGPGTDNGSMGPGVVGPIVQYDTRHECIRIF